MIACSSDKGTIHIFKILGKAGSKITLSDENADMEEERKEMAVDAAESGANEKEQKNPRHV